LPEGKTPIDIWLLMLILQECEMLIPIMINDGKINSIAQKDALEKIVRILIDQ
jgi:hypothetical protein